MFKRKQIDADKLLKKWKTEEQVKEEDEKKKILPPIPKNQPKMLSSTRVQLNSALQFGLSELKAANLFTPLEVNWVSGNRQTTTVQVGKKENTVILYNENNSKSVLRNEDYNVSHILVYAKYAPNITVEIIENPKVESINSDNVSTQMYSNKSGYELTIYKNGENYAVTFSDGQNQLLDKYFIFKGDESYSAVKQLYDGSVSKAMKLIGK